MAQSPAIESLRAGSLCSRAVDARMGSAQHEVKERATASEPYREFFRGCALLATGKPGDAVAAFEKARDVAPTDGVVLLWLGRAYGSDAQRVFVARQAIVARRARDAFDKAISVAPDYLAAREARLQFALQAPGFLGGGVERARREAMEIQRRDEHRGRLADLAMARHVGDRQRSVTLLSRIIADHPDSVSYALNLATEYGVLREWSHAWRTLDSAERRMPESLRVRLAIGTLADDSRQQELRGRAALQSYLSQLADSAPRLRAVALVRLGHLYERGNLTDSARQAYTAAVALDPTMKEPLEGLRRVNRR